MARLIRQVWQDCHSRVVVRFLHRAGLRLAYAVCVLLLVLLFYPTLGHAYAHPHAYTQGRGLAVSARVAVGPILPNPF